MKGVTALAHPALNPYNHLYVGDKFGNVSIFDLNKKNIILKKEILPERRVIDLQVVQFKYEESELATISIILHGHKDVYIYRMKTSDMKLLHAFTIPLGRNVTTIAENTPAGSFAFKATISPDARYISLTLYSGNVEVYRIPDPPAVVQNLAPIDSSPSKLPQISKPAIPSAMKPQD
jgi:hypothetical protein